MRLALNKTKKKVIWAFGILAVFSAACFFCAEFGLNVLIKSEKREKVTLRIDGNYAIDSSSALETINNNDSLVFQKLDPELLLFEFPEVSPPVTWTQSDYFTIANEFLRYIGDEPINKDTAVRTLSFRLTCEDVQFGLQDLRMRLYREGLVDQERSHIEIGLYVLPQKRLVSWNKSEYVPDLRSQPTIKLGDIKIPAEQALQIAEDNGGRQARESVNNMCDIEIGIAGGVLGNDWGIGYRGDKSKGLFGITIDEKTGDYEVSPKLK
jgi:hypothetical protein